jgi:hypothetical protein
MDTEICVPPRPRFLAGLPAVFGPLREQTITVESVDDNGSQDADRLDR